MALPKRLRRLTPDRLRDSPRLRALAVGGGLIPPRTMHTPGEAELLARLARGRRRAVEIGVYEGASAVVLCRSLPEEAELHLIDPFTENALVPGWRGSAPATRRVVDRALRDGGPRVHWHLDLSHAVAGRWSAPVDLVFVDGDHSEAGCMLDWRSWSPFVEPGGVVAFDDARDGEDGGWGLPGPTAVVDSLFRQGGAGSGWRLAAELDSTVVVASEDPGQTDG